MYSTLALTCFLSFVDATLTIHVDKEAKSVVTAHIFDNQNATYNDLYLNVNELTEESLKLSGTSSQDSSLVSVDVDMHGDFRWGTTRMQYGHQHETLSCFVSN